MTAIPHDRSNPEHRAMVRKLTDERRAEYRASINAALDRNKIKIKAQGLYVDALTDALTGIFWAGGLNRFVPIETAVITEDDHGHLLTVTTYSGPSYEGRQACVIVTLESGDE